jgi:DNA repair exonuclease SbcCD ATPase subunit
MPHPVCEPAGYAIAQMAEVLKHGDNFIDSAAERRAVIEKLCGESEAALHQAQSALGPVKAEYDRVKKDLKAKSAILEDQKARSLAAINSQIETAQAELGGLTARVEKARQAIIDTDRSTESLIRRLRIG